MNLVLLSGGIDSTTALFWSISEKQNTEAIIFKYPSLHNKQEIKSAKNICNILNIKYHEIDCNNIFLGFKSSLLKGNDSAKVKGAYNEENIKSLVIPFRNGIFLSIATGLSESIGFKNVILANHLGDHRIYPDCTDSFIRSMNQAIESGSGGKISIISPFCNIKKKDIVKIGLRLGVDYSLTYSCYHGEEFHCNICPTCIESNEAFAKNGLQIKR